MSVAAISIGAPAYAFCTEPMLSFRQQKLPDAPSWQRPDKPFCLQGYKYTGQHSCGDWELDRFISDVEQYQQDLINYLEEVYEFQRAVERAVAEAESFALCEQEEVTEIFR